MALTKVHNRMIQDAAANVVDFGADPTGATDSTIAVQAAMDASDLVYIPNGTFIVDGLVTTQANSIFGVGVLKLEANASSDYVLNLANDSCSVDGIVIDGNRSGHSTYAGRGEGLRITSNYSVITNVTSQNQPIGSFANSFYIDTSASYTIIENCRSFNAGYSGCRNRGNFTTIKSFVGINWEQKGINCDASADSFIVDGAYLTSTSANSGMDNLLVDAGVGNEVKYFYAKNVYAVGPENAIDGNCTKVAYSTNSFYENCVFTHTNAAIDTLRVQAYANYSVTLKNSTFSRTINYDQNVSSLLYMENCVVGLDGGAAVTHCVDDNIVDRVIIKGCTFRNFTAGAIKLEDAAQYVSVDDTDFIAHGTATSATIFTTDSAPEAGKIFITNISRSGGTFDTDPYTGTSGRDVRIMFGGTEFRRTFLGISPPASGDWLAGDIFYDKTPSASGKIGWVCTVSGTPGTWKAFGAIDA